MGEAGLHIVPFWSGTVCTVRTFNQSYFELQHSCSMRNLCLSYERQVYALCPSGVVQFAQSEHSISRILNYSICALCEICVFQMRGRFTHCALLEWYSLHSSNIQSVAF